MPSLRYRFCKIFVRLNQLLSLGSHGPVKYQRFMLDLVASLSPRTPGIKHEPLNISGIPAEWVIPDDSQSDQVLLYFHGGGYTEGSIRSHRALVSRLAATAGCHALMIEYRLAPENKFPCAVEDALTSYKWLLSKGYDPAKIVIAGDSAGGGLAMAALISLRDSGDPLPAAAMLLSKSLGKASRRLASEIPC
jgi:monoterpene epsilon-lactone hydrolase